MVMGSGVQKVLLLLEGAWAKYDGDANDGGQCCDGMWPVLSCDRRCPPIINMCPPFPSVLRGIAQCCCHCQRHVFVFFRQRRGSDHIGTAAFIKLRFIVRNRRAVRGPTQ